MSPDTSETIVALSSAPPGRGQAGHVGRAIVRLSGPRAWELANLVFRAAVPRGRPSGWERLPGQVEWRGHELPASAYVMPGPRSYTRQDLVELNLPALRQVVVETLERLVRSGARLAAPGEFTRRAFLNGRLALAQAEAVGALVRAGSADEARAWAAQASGADAGPAAVLRRELEDLLTQVEAGLDFSPEEVPCLGRPELLARLRACAARAQAAAGPASEAGAAGLLGGPPRVALAGPANAGKSSLFNALLGREEALVSPARHTTRDVLEAGWEIRPGIPVRLFDTAGLGPGTERDEFVGLAQDATARVLLGADILLLTLDRSARAAPEGELSPLLAALRKLRPAAAALLWTKADLPAAEGWPAAAPRVRAALASCGAAARSAEFLVSAHRGAGLPELLEFLSREAQALGGRVAAVRAAGEASARAGRVRAVEALARAAEGLQTGLGEDAAAVELREALHALSESEGALPRHDTLTERMLDRIFSTFCIGK